MTNEKKSLQNLSLEKNLNLKQVYLDTQIKNIIEISSIFAYSYKLSPKNNSKYRLFGIIGFRNS